MREVEDMNRVSKAIIVGDLEGFNKDKILILRRSKRLITKESPWEWDLPGGHVHEGEPDDEALRREVEEETNIELLHVPHWFMLAKNTRCYFVLDWQGSLQLSDEHDDFEWIEPKEATNYNLGKMYTNAIKQAFSKE